ncbi:MAG: DUF2318 domain-containing protein, partial [Anaerolineales bacterium]|nr:DUF2318 domain-containing protein [Anaerolineales bacterium]
LPSVNLVVVLVVSSVVIAGGAFGLIRFFSNSPESSDPYTIIRPGSPSTVANAPTSDTPVKLGETPLNESAESVPATTPDSVPSPEVMATANAPTSDTPIEFGETPLNENAESVPVTTPDSVPSPEVMATVDIERFPLSTFDDYKAHYYTYVHEEQAIKFFILKSADGVVRAAFDACDVCYGAKKGYRQDGEEMVCMNCGLRFPANRINEVRGGCNPAPLHRTVKGDTLVIQADDIVAGLRYF